MLTNLTALPNIGKAIAADLMAIGIDSSDDLKTVMGHRHDPCVYYTLLSVKHFIDTGESLPWWNFTVKGKADLASSARRKS